jgi:hypothetical protein
MKQRELLGGVTHKSPYFAKDKRRSQRKPSISIVNRKEQSQNKRKSIFGVAFVKVTLSKKQRKGLSGRILWGM